ncbi:MAG: hypothetical protein ACREQI_16530, partial [Candidatus Binataceae bacterium]
LNIPLCCSSVPRIPASSSTHNGHLSIYLGAERKAIIFPHPASGDKTGLSAPAALVLDSSGNIYVANGGGQNSPGSITVYPPGANGDVAPVRTITGKRTGFGVPNGIAIGPMAPGR